MLVMKGYHFLKIDGAQNIDIAHKKRFFTVEELFCIQQSATRVKQEICLVGNVNRNAKIVRFYKINDLLGKMMYVDHKFGKARIL